MTEQEFIRSGSAAWSKLGSYVQRAGERGIDVLSADEVIELHEGYRRAASDLAYAQTHFPRTETLAELNALVAAAHGFLYAAPPRRFARLIDFYVAGVPRLVRANIRPIMLACALMLGAALLAFVAAQADPSLGRALLPAQYRDAVSQRIASGSGQSAIPGSLGPLISTQIMINNIQVSFLAFAGGALAGTVTVYMLLSNGLLLGALSGLFGAAGLAVPFLALVVPHGSLELPAIVIAAGAGFVIARGILFPGERPRRETIRESANTAVRLLLGTLPMFIVAALVEGFVTPAEAPASVKLLLGGALFALLVGWLALGGRGEEAAA